MNTLIKKCVAVVVLFSFSICIVKPVFADPTVEDNIKNKLLEKNIEPVKITKSNETIIAETVDSVQKSGKSPILAFIIALFPGVIIHGSGHYYVGKPKTGTLLLTVELLSIAAVGAGMILVALGATLKAITLGKGDVSEIFSPVGILVYGGTLGFIFSWIYDIIGAPLSCSNKINTQQPFVRPIIPQLLLMTPYSKIGNDLYQLEFVNLKIKF